MKRVIDESLPGGSSDGDGADTGWRGFLDGSDTQDVDLGGWFLQRMARGELVELEPGLLADVVALSAPYSCVPADCTPGRRLPRRRSCCADLVVTPSEAERAQIEAVLDAPELAADPRWADGVPAVFDEDGALTRPGRRCVFARATPDGLRCGLHALEDARGWRRGRVKPMPCRLFPLALVAIDDETAVLTALHRRTATALSGRPAAAFPCLHRAGAPPLAIAERDTLVASFGEAVFDTLAAEIGARR